MAATFGARRSSALQRLPLSLPTATRPSLQVKRTVVALATPSSRRCSIPSLWRPHLFHPASSHLRGLSSLASSSTWPSKSCSSSSFSSFRPRNWATLQLSPLKVAHPHERTEVVYFSSTSLEDHYNNVIDDKNDNASNNDNASDNYDDVDHNNDNDNASDDEDDLMEERGGRSHGGIRLSMLLSRHLGTSRRQAERMLRNDRVTLFGTNVTSPFLVVVDGKGGGNNGGRDGDLTMDIGPNVAMKVDGKLLQGVYQTFTELVAEEVNTTPPTSRGTQSPNSVLAPSPSSLSTTSGRRVRVWLANKLRGELVTESDPDGRPSIMERLTRGGVGAASKRKRSVGKGGAAQAEHLKAVGRLDMMTEGLMVVTNDGSYARDLELPSNKLWRTYRCRAHGRLTLGKLRAIRSGLTVREGHTTIGGEGIPQKSAGTVMRYGGMKVSIERGGGSKNGGGGGGGGGPGGGRRQRRKGDTNERGGTNVWLRITCAEGKNRQIRRVLAALGLDVTRLIRTSFGDYDLNTIPPGMAIEVNAKPWETMKRRGKLESRLPVDRKKEGGDEDGGEMKTAPSIEWVTHAR